MVKGKVGKERPRSSANKRKKGGSPDGSDVPLDSQLTSFDNFHQPPVVDVIRGPEVEELLITHSDMVAKRPQRVPSPPKELKSIEVRKKHVLSNAPTKTISVLKKVDSSLPDVAAQSAGPRFNAKGEILPYTLLGPVDQYKKSMLSTGNEEESKAPKPIYVTPSEPETLQESREGKALKNWERQLQEHSKQMDILANRTGKSPSSLLMSQTNEYRFKQEERTIVDRAIPVVDRGKGFRVGSEFWSQPQQIGGNNSAIVMTLNQSEQGQNPELERIGHPFRQESRQGQIYPWKRNKFFEQRRKELGGVMTEHEPHAPDFGGLYIQGKTEQPSDDMEEKDRVTLSPEDDIADVKEGLTLEDEQPVPNKGPVLEVNGIESRWAAKKQDPTVIRVLFDTDAGVIANQNLKLKNTGTTAIFYAWKFLPKENKLNTIMEGNKQRFYFSINDGVILPGEDISIPLIFLSKQAGIYTESWQLITKPVLDTGCPLIVTFKGIALKRDIFKAEKENIEDLLEKRQAQYNVKLIVEELVRGVHTPPPSPPPAPPGPTLAKRFDDKNPYLHYQSDYYLEAETMWGEVVEEGRTWDETIASLREAILHLPRETQAEKMEEFNKLRAKLTNARPKPISEEAFDLCYGCLRGAMDTLEEEDKSLRLQLRVPERVHIEEPPPVEQDAVSEKTAPESKKGKKDDKKKDSKPGSKAETKPRTVSKNSKKSEQQLIPDEEEIVEKKEWEDIADPVLKSKYREKLTILTHSILSSCADHIALALEEQLGKPF